MRCHKNLTMRFPTQKTNTETNIDCKLTKISRPGLDPSKIHVWIFLTPNPTPINDGPSWSNLPICAKSGKVFLSGQESNPKVWVYREKFNIGNFTQNFFVVFHTCWEYAISFSEKFSMLKFSPSPSTSPSPLSGPYFKKWEIWGFLFFSKWKWVKKNIGFFSSYSVWTSNVKNDF